MVHNNRFLAWAKEMLQAPIIIIGSGLAGYQLAREFRRLDQTTPIWIVTADEGHFYSKPQLSVSLTGQKTPEALIMSSATQMAEQLNAEVFTHTKVTAIDTHKKIVVFDKKEYPFAKLVLALGASPARPPLEGSAIEDVFSVNHLGDYALFRKKITNKKSITLLGAGLIGCEFANDLANTGHTVNVITPAKTPIELLLPEHLGEILQTSLEEQGIRFHTGCTATHIDHTENDQYRIQLSNGSTLIADAILSATGLRPMTTLAKAAGLAVSRGIAVNRWLETSVTDIYALGDCAEVESFVLPFITPLLNAARALAKTLAGTRTAVSYPAMPVTIKTPAHPVVVCPPPKDMAGEWQTEKTETSNDAIRALFIDKNGTLRGFILMGACIREKNDLAKKIPPLID